MKRKTFHKNIFVILIFLVSTLCTIGGCAKIQKEQKKLYLSITETFEDSSGQMMSNVKCMNLDDSKSVSELESECVEYASQCPLAICDKENNTIYYSDRVSAEDDYGDQLFAYDMATKEITQLTNDIYAINYIIPVKESIYMLGVMKNTHYLTIIKYDLKTEKLSVFDSEGKWDFDLLVYDVYSDKLYASACIAEEKDTCLEEYNSRTEEKDDDKYIPPDYTVFEFDKDFHKPKEIFHTKREYVRRMAPTPDGKLFITFADTIPVMNPTYESKYLDLNSGRLYEAPSIDEATYVTEFIYFLPNDDKIYFIGVDEEQNIRGLCSYDPDSQNVKMLYKSDKGYINNCFMLGVK